MIGKGWKLAALFLLVFLLGFVVWEIRDFGYPQGDPDYDQTIDPSSVDYDPERTENIPVYNEATDEVVYVNRTFMDGKIIFESIDPEGTTHSSNVVTGVVFDFRGFDTLGEATVLFAAVSGVMLALRAAYPKKKGGDEK